MPQKLAKAIQILKSLNQPDRVINRDRINFTKLMHLLGNPFKSFKSIHVTGTNGKGSVCAKTSAILNAAGYKTGIYTSPHLFSFRERIKIGEEMITAQEISDMIIKLDELSQKEQLPLSYFEYLTAVGFLYYQKQGCQYVALQVGLGGKNDTTNIVNPEISVITSIGLDHMDLLGPTKEHIAREKSGIIKPKKPVVVGPNAQGYESIEEAIKKNDCPFFRVGQKEYDHSDFQSQNRAITLKCIQALKFANPALEISEQHIKKGLQAHQPCRMELLEEKWLPKWAKDKLVYFDVGHNPQALRKVAQFLHKKGYKKQQISYIFGTSKGKKFDQSLQQIQDICDHIYLVQANHFRACKLSQLQSYIGSSKYPSKYRCFGDGNVSKTVQIVTMDPTCKVIVVSGSFFIMPEAKGYFQPDLIAHPEENINEIYQLKQNNNAKN